MKLSRRQWCACCGRPIEGTNTELCDGCAYMFAHDLVDIEELYADPLGAITNDRKLDWPRQRRNSE